MESENAPSTPQASTHFPKSKIKRISKLVCEPFIITSEAVDLLGSGAEEYVRILAREAFKFANSDKRKTVQRRDIDKCIQRDWMFSILEDAIDDWPEKASGGLSADISDAFVADNAENNDTETSEADENRRPGDEIQVKQPEEDGQLGSVEPLTNQSMSVRDIEDF